MHNKSRIEYLRNEMGWIKGFIEDTSISSATRRGYKSDYNKLARELQTLLHEEIREMSNSSEFAGGEPETRRKVAALRKERDEL